MPRWMEKPALQAALLFGLTLLLYAPVLGHEFTNYDDDVCITANPALRDGLTAESFRWALTATEGGHWGPLTWMSLALDVSLFGFDARGFLAENALLHALDCVLVFFLFRRLLGASSLPLLLAAIFAWHPMRVESVAWAIERKDVLCAFFYLLLLIANDHAQRTERPGPWRYGVVPLLHALALMSKPMAITAPALLLVLDVFHYGRWQGDTVGARVRCAALLVLEKTPLWLMCGASAWLTMNALAHAMADDTAYPLWLRAANALRAYGWYFGKIVLPTGLCVLYPFRIEEVTALRALGGAGVILGLGACAAWARSPRMAAGLLWFVGLLVPVIGLVQVGEQVYADRYSYLPSLGLLWMLGVAVQRTPRVQRPVQWVGAVCAILLAMATFVQLGHWRNSETLFLRVIAVDPENATAHANLGSFYYERGDTGRARTLFEQALALSPTSFEANYNLGALLVAEGDAANALPLLEVAVKQRSTQGEARNNLGMALLQLNQNTEAMEHLEVAVRISPGNAAAHANLGVCYLRMGEKARAANCFRAALQLDPNNAAIQKNLALTGY